MNDLTNKPRWLKPARLIPLFLVALVIIGVVGYRIASRSGLQRELAEIRAKGLPTNPAELDKWYAAVPAQENAGLKFLSAHEVYVEPAKGSDPAEVDWRAISHTNRLDADLMRMLEEHLAKNAETLQRMHEAAKFRLSRYPADHSKAPETLLPHLWQLKKLANLARWESVWKAERGDARGAVEALKSGFALSHTLAQEPLLISELVRMAYLAITLAGIERVVNVADFSEQELTDLIEMTRAAAEDCPRALNRALIGERAFANTGRTLTYDDYEQSFAWGGTPMLSDEWPEFVRRALYNLRSGIGIHHRDHAYYLRSLGKMIDATALPHPAMLAKADEVELEIALEIRAHPFIYLWSNMSLPSLFHAPQKEVFLEARLRCVVMALEIEHYRARNAGKLPPADELAPTLFKEWPTDPVDGKPLKFRLEEKGYSVIAASASAKEAAGKTGAQMRPIEFKVVK